MAILKARAEKGSSSSDFLEASVPSWSITPVTALIWLGEGRKSITASSIVWTPLFLKADPQRQITISDSKVLCLNPSLISSSVKSPSSRYLFINSSLASAADSSIFSRHNMQASIISSGISSSI